MCAPLPGVPTQLQLTVACRNGAWAARLSVSLCFVRFNLVLIFIEVMHSLKRQMLVVHKWSQWKEEALPHSRGLSLLSLHLVSANCLRFSKQCGYTAVSFLFKNTSYISCAILLQKRGIELSVLPQLCHSQHFPPILPESPFKYSVFILSGPIDIIQSCLYFFSFDNFVSLELIVVLSFFHLHVFCVFVTNPAPTYLPEE